MAIEESNFEQKFATLKIAYIAKLPKKIADIHNDWNALKTKHSAETIQLLYRNVHTLIGTSGTFGFTELSQSARDLETTIRPLIENSTQNFSFNAELAKKIGDHIQHLLSLLDIIQREEKAVE